MLRVGPQPHKHTHPTHTTQRHPQTQKVACVEAFKEFYDVDAKHRKLSWVYTQGTAVLRGGFSARPIEMVLSTLQAALLLLFNEVDELSFAEVCERLHLGEDDVKGGGAGAGVGEGLGRAVDGGHCGAGRGGGVGSAGSSIPGGPARRALGAPAHRRSRAPAA